MDVKTIFANLRKKAHLPIFIVKRLPKEFKKLFLFAYIFVLLTSIILTLVYAFVPTFTTCSSLFGEKFCTPTGIFLALFASLPGYLLAGNALSFLPDVPWIISLVAVVIVSGIFYYLLGFVIDKQRGKKFTSDSFVKSVIILSLVVFILLLLTLLTRRSG